jgi:hypothetical protein
VVEPVPELLSFSAELELPELAPGVELLLSEEELELALGLELLLSDELELEELPELEPIPPELPALEDGPGDGVVRLAEDESLPDEPEGALRDVAPVPALPELGLWSPHAANVAASAETAHSFANVPTLKSMFRALLLKGD